MKRARFWLTCFMALCAAYAHAHPDWYLDRIKAPHGGQLRAAGAFHLEVVLTADALKVYVTDHFGNRFPTKNSSATAVVLHRGEASKVQLTPGGDNLLQASGSFELDAQTLVGVILHAHRYEPQVARFTPFKKPLPTLPEEDLRKPMPQQP